MKHIFTALLILILLSGICSAQRSPRIPKPSAEAEKTAAALDASFDKKNATPGHNPATNPFELKRDAEQLLVLAQTVRAQIDSVNRGMLPKDLIVKLKQIEKLSKHLRNELNP